jgi:alpha,alpha-trehalase
MHPELSDPLSANPCLHRPRWQTIASGLVILLTVSTPIGAQQPQKNTEKGLGPILSYISAGWDTLSRSPSDCATFTDSKLTTKPQLYLPANFVVPESVKQLESRCDVQVKNLPPSADQLGKASSESIDPPGLLYLENRYVVPGGRFNEMYGWDSYFIIVGLLRDGRLDLAKGMVDNFLFEVEHYGAVLNANRTYYLTRSQPPFLTSMILAVYDVQKAAGHEDLSWLRKAYKLAVKEHSLWTTAPHLAGNTGLSRYYDFGEGPAPESLKDETGHYRDVVAFFLAHPELDHHLLVRKAPGETSPLTFGSSYSLQVCDTTQTKAKSECTVATEVSLSSDFYKGDRSMRESGFDISFRFGPYGAETHHYAPVCLNSLLYKAEKDLERMSTVLGSKEEVEEWKKRAEERKVSINKYLWDGQRGMFFDYQFQAQARSTYEYVTTFYPLWAGLATPDQARALVQHLPTFEQPGGLAMSPKETGAQWDFPYAWAPNQLLTDEGLRQYGFNKEADRISYKFLSTVAENFRRDGTIREKYNAVTRSSETEITSGYHVNVVGFGWTNGAFLELLRELPAELAQKLSSEQASSAPQTH